MSRELFWISAGSLGVAALAVASAGRDAAASIASAERRHEAERFRAERLATLPSSVPPAPRIGRVGCQPDPVPAIRLATSSASRGVPRCRREGFKGASVIWRTPSDF